MNLLKVQSERLKWVLKLKVKSLKSKEKMESGEKENGNRKRETDAAKT